jgi:trehalose 6-phosphate phosphatase
MRRPASARGPGAARPAIPLDSPAGPRAYFFDIDGTLVDIAGTPDSVHLDRELCHLIERLHRSAGGAVALISGRTIADIDRLFPGEHLPAAGQHGIERRDAAGRVSRHSFPSSQLPWARRRLAEAVAAHPGLLLEDKGLSLALHYRLAPQLAGYSHRLVRSVQARLGSAYCVQAGKRIIEVKPAGKDKGVAVREFMQEEPFAGRMPVFVGDDATDEYGFAMVNRLHGQSVKVGAGQTVARWRLPDVRAVRQWLEESIARLGIERAERAEAIP